MKNIYMNRMKCNLIIFIDWTISYVAYMYHLCNLMDRHERAFNRQAKKNTEYDEHISNVFPKMKVQIAVRIPFCGSIY